MVEKHDDIRRKPRSMRAEYGTIMPLPSLISMTQPNVGSVLCFPPHAQRSRFCGAQVSFPRGRASLSGAGPSFPRCAKSRYYSCREMVTIGPTVPRCLSIEHLGKADQELILHVRRLHYSLTCLFISAGYLSVLRSACCLLPPVLSGLAAHVLFVARPEMRARVLLSEAAWFVFSLGTFYLDWTITSKH